MSKKSQLITSYAKSLFIKAVELSKPGDDSLSISKITSSSQKSESSDYFLLGEELLLTRAVFIASPSVRNFFKNPTYPEYEKLDVLVTIFPGLTSLTKSFFKFLGERGHLSLIPEISEAYNKILLRVRNIKKVRLITAAELNEDFGPSLLESLKKMTEAKEIIFKIAYCPGIIGGFILEYDSIAIDASVLKEFGLLFENL
jgi:ATP synthase F1 delta subunit